MQRDFTLTDKKLTWTRYLATIRDPYGWADELVVMCMALFLGKDIMQFSDSSVKTKPWCVIPGQVDGWPFPVTTPPIIMGNCNPWHFEPLRYKPPLTREVACIGCGWTGKHLKSHLMRTAKSCKLFYNMDNIHVNPAKLHTQKTYTEEKQIQYSCIEKASSDKSNLFGHVRTHRRMITPTHYLWKKIW